MLFVKSKTTRLSIDTASRISLLEKLHEKGLVPLIHSSRLRGYELVLRGTARVKERMKELEQTMARWADTQGESYVLGDVFCLDDCVAFLAFEDEEGQLAEVRTPELCRYRPHILRASVAHSDYVGMTLHRRVLVVRPKLGLGLDQGSSPTGTELIRSDA